jgi:hypothetical protein
MILIIWQKAGASDGQMSSNSMGPPDSDPCWKPKAALRLSWVLLRQKTKKGEGALRFGKQEDNSSGAQGPIRTQHRAKFYGAIAFGSTHQVVKNLQSKYGTTEKEGAE